MKDCFLLAVWNHSMQNMLEASRCPVAKLEEHGQYEEKEAANMLEDHEGLEV